MTCFYDFLNDQFRYTRKHSDEHHDVKHHLFIFEVFFLNSLEILYLYVPPMEVLM